MKSVFDGWTKKIENRGVDGAGGFCARGWIYLGARHDRTQAEITDIERRIGNWIIQNLNPPLLYIHPLDAILMLPAECPFSAIVWANNECKLDIEGFRMVDLLSQGYVPEAAAETTEREEIAIHV